MGGYKSIDAGNVLDYYFSVLRILLSGSQYGPQPYPALIGPIFRCKFIYYLRQSFYSI
jgi:hypothetical protein